MSEGGYVPEPMTAHPHYAGQADGIRGLIDGRRMAIQVAELPRLSAIATADPPPLMESGIAKRTLVIKKCAGLAPFIGDPLWEDGRYFWFAAVDDLGRHVAGDATLEVIQRPARGQ